MARSRSSSRRSNSNRAHRIALIQQQTAPSPVNMPDTIEQASEESIDVPNTVEQAIAIAPGGIRPDEIFEERWEEIEALSRENITKESRQIYARWVNKFKDSLRADNAYPPRT